MNRSKSLLIILIAALVLIPSCDNVESGTFSGIYFGRPPRKLRDGQGYFEMWLGFPASSGGKEWVSILKFDRVESTNKPFLNDKAAILKRPNRNINDAVSAAISIELENDIDPSVPNRIFMSGEFTDGIASLELSGEDALNLDLSDPAVISGKFVLGTPSDAINNNDDSGVWFVDAPFGQQQNPGLSLPVLPIGFKYEAWIATQSETVCISTGQFKRADSLDYNGKGPNGGGELTPNVPGEDLVFNQFNEDVQGRTVDASLQEAYLDTFGFPIHIKKTIQKNPLTNAKDYWDVVVSVEPDPDNDPEEPFAIFPLVKFGPIFESVNTVIPLTNFTGGVSQYIVIDLSKM
ncbi:MAG TPA: hypothetical protein PLH27_08130 [bacterium]|nr:hypothetical protein [bacterium]HNB10094.1 hypothetical protein [bacterium]HNC48937.1 hypothetical protein [bacterium]HNH31884.1 hypothetical protein [bacterium]HNI11550.1 hypothetical protein [bacterium]